MSETAIYEMVEICVKGDVVSRESAPYLHRNLEVFFQEQQTELAALRKRVEELTWQRAAIDKQIRKKNQQLKNAEFKNDELRQQNELLRARLGDKTPMSCSCGWHGDENEAIHAGINYFLCPVCENSIAEAASEGGEFTADTQPFHADILSDYTDQEKADFANEWARDFAEGGE